MVAQALNNQKLVLDQINALNTTTSSLIESTSVMLKRQTAQIHEQASNSGVEVEKLQIAFNNIYDTMGAIDTFKVKALDNMKQTVNVLTQAVDKAQVYLDKAQQKTALEVAQNLHIEAKKWGEVKI